MLAIFNAIYGFSQLFGVAVPFIALVSITVTIWGATIVVNKDRSGFERMVGLFVTILGISVLNTCVQFWRYL